MSDNRRKSDIRSNDILPSFGASEKQFKLLPKSDELGVEHWDRLQDPSDDELEVCRNKVARWNSGLLETWTDRERWIVDNFVNDDRDR